MSEIGRVEAADVAPYDPHAWLGHVLDHFARAEQAIGKLSLALDLPIANGSLGSLAEIRRRLTAVPERKCGALERRIDRWSKNRPFRHLLAHATITILFDAEGQRIISTRHLPRDATDVTPDRLWTEQECSELLRQASNDSRSICDLVRNLLADPATLDRLRKA